MKVYCRACGNYFEARPQLNTQRSDHYFAHLGTTTIEREAAVDLIRHLQGLDDSAAIEDVVNVIEQVAPQMNWLRRFVREYKDELAAIGSAAGVVSLIISVIALLGGGLQPDSSSPPAPQPAHTQSVSPPEPEEPTREDLSQVLQYLNRWAKDHPEDWREPPPSPTGGVSE